MMVFCQDSDTFMLTYEEMKNDNYITLQLTEHEIVLFYIPAYFSFQDSRNISLQFPNTEKDS